MKVQELFEAEESIFKKMARENRERLKKAREADRAAEKAHKQAMSSAKKERKKKLDVELFHKVMNAVSSSFPDGDPFDHFSGYLNRNNLDMSDVDRVMRKFEGHSYYDYLSNLWKYASADSIHDGNNAIARGERPEHSVFYDWHEGDKTVTPTPNPWK